jgi:hypothetical protein
MRRVILISIFCMLMMAVSARAASGRVVKVLPQFLDLKGQHTVSPSLYDRDAYQVVLRDHPEQRSGMRFAVQWKAHGRTTAPLKLRAELRGVSNGNLPPHTTLEKEIQPGGWLSNWASLALTGDAYQKFGNVTAWRVTLWEGDKLLSEQKSFLW